MESHDQHLDGHPGGAAQSDHAVAPDLVQALTTVEYEGRLAVHAAVALERGQVDVAMWMLGEITLASAQAVQELSGSPATATAVRTAARDLVNPLVGWSGA